MAKKTNKDLKRNLQKYKENHLNNATPEGIELEQLLREGHAMLEKEGTPVPITIVVTKPVEDSPKKLEDTLAAKSTNPYIRARVEILKKYPLWKKHEMESYERNGKTDNRHYEQFVREVRELGDSFSS